MAVRASTRLNVILWCHFVSSRALLQSTVRHILLINQYNDPVFINLSWQTFFELRAINTNGQHHTNVKLNKLSSSELSKVIYNGYQENLEKQCEALISYNYPKNTSL